MTVDTLGPSNTFDLINCRPSEGKVKKGGWERVGEENQDDDMEVEEDGDEGAYVRSKSSKSRPAILEAHCHI